MLASGSVGPRDVLSKRSRVYRERQAEIDAMTDDELLQAMVEEPTLLRRPLVISGGTFVAGFDRTGLSSIADAETGNE